MFNKYPKNNRILRDFFKPSAVEKRVFLHLYNYCVENTPDEKPLNDLDKEKFLKILKRLLELYTIECLSAVCLPNHFHLIVTVGLEKLSPYEMAIRLNKQRGIFAPPLKPDDELVVNRAEHSNDISHFMKELQRLYTHWFNKNRHFDRRGTLWEQRFKSQKLLGKEAIINCMQYVEHLPVRAGLCDNAADYRFSTYGRWQQSGRHLFRNSFEKHFKYLLSNELQTHNLTGIEQYFKARYEKMPQEKINGNVSIKNRLLRKSRYYLDSVMLGSEEILREQGRRIWGDEKTERQKFHRVQLGDCWFFSTRKFLEYMIIRSIK